MICSSAPAGMIDGLRQVPLTRGQLGCLQQLRHAHDAVIGVRFRGSCVREIRSWRCWAFRALWRASPHRDELQLAVGVAQILRASATCVEKLTVLSRRESRWPDLPEH